MKTYHIALFVISLFLMHSLPAAGQSLVVDRMDADKESKFENSYPALDRQLRFSIEAGYSYRTGKMDKGVPSDLRRKLRSGVNFGGDLTYFPVEAWGMGAKFSGRHFNAKTDYIEDKVRMYYIAPQFAMRIFDRAGRNAFVWGVSVGYLSFHEKAKTGGMEASVSKGGFGSTLEVGYDIRISRKSFIGFKFSATSGRVTLDTGSGNVKENASSLDLSAGFRF